MPVLRVIVVLHLWRLIEKVFSLCKMAFSLGYFLGLDIVLVDGER